MQCLDFECPGKGDVRFTYTHEKFVFASVVGLQYVHVADSSAYVEEEEDSRDR